MKRSLLLCVLSTLLFGPAPARAEAPAAPADGPVYVIPVKGMIEPALLYVMRRGVQEAEREGAAAVVLLMDTPGGRLDAATDIVRLMQGVRVPTYTFVEKNAISAGAIIALSTKHIYMAPGSVIGDAMPIMMSPTGGAQEMPEAIEEKTVSAVAALIRAAAQESGHDPQLAEAMVRRELEYKIGDEVISPAGQLLTLTNVEAEREVGPEDGRRRLLSKGTVADIPALLEKIGLAGRPIRELEVTSTERLARMIAAAAPLLLMAGLLGLYIEFKTPGFGLPGLLGLAALALFFWGHHIAGLAGMEEMIVFLVGLLLIALEVFILPGFGIPGIAGLVLVLYALLNAMMDKLPDGQWLPGIDSLEGPLRTLSIAIVGSFTGAVLVGRFLPHSPARRWLVLAQSTDTKSGYTAAPQQPDLVGLRGATITALRPAGTAQFGDRRLDVVTEGLFVDPGTPVRIASVHGSRIVVELDRTAP
jgi:membrane-bound serine protease (ClpP class)